MDERLAGRRVLVTGASSGIGEVTARAVVAAGGGVALLARRADALEALAAELGEQAVAVPADVTDHAATRVAVDRAAEAMGGLDALVNAAGMVRPARMSDADPDGWRAMFAVNVVGLLSVTQAAIPHLRDADPADVVNVSSMSGRRRTSLELTVYAGTKHAVHVISDGLREELKDDGIRVTIISPGFVRTELFDDVPEDDVRTRYRQAMTDQGLAPTVVADEIVHALAQPAGVVLHEIAMLSTEQ